MSDNHSVISDSNYFERRGSLPANPVPIRFVIGYNGLHSESEASGCTFVTPQPRRRRPSHSAVLQHHHRQHRKVSAPPELQAHLGSFNTNPIINLSSATPKGGASHNPVETAPNELIINLNQSNKLGVPEGLHSGSDSGVPSEYSSWAPISSHCNSLTAYEDVKARSINGSLEDIPSSESLSDTDDEMSSPHRYHREHIEQAPQITVQQDSHNQPLVLAVAPPPLNRAHTDTNLLSGPSPVPPQSRQRTNSMVFQLNLGNALPGVNNTLPNARSVSMISLDTAGNHGQSGYYPNLNTLNNMDSQSIYSDAGAPAHFTPGLLRSNLTGSQGSLSGIGFAGMNGNFNAHHNIGEDSKETPEMDESAKHEWLMDTMSKNLSTMYAILLFMIGIVFYTYDTYSYSLERKSAMGAAFNVYLIVVQLMWFVYIHIDIRKYIHKISGALEHAKDKEVQEDPIKLEPTPDGQYQIRINLPEPRKTISQSYGFTSGRHAGSIYLKIGAAVFCLGYLIHSGLNLGQKILFLIHRDDPAFHSCTCFQEVLLSVLQPIYAFYQLFFIFKFSNLIINCRKKLSRFALMHCISASFLFWIYAILQETMLAINSKKQKETTFDNVTMTTAFPSAGGSVLGEEMDSEEDKEDAYDGINDQYNDAYPSYTYCNTNKLPLSKMLNDTTPYLFPFTIEYNILIVGIWILIWENIGKMDRHTHLPSVQMTYEDDNTKGISSNLIIYVDCHSSNRGMFAGLLMTVATVTSIILFFIFSADESTKRLGEIVNGASEIIVLGIMIITAILAYLSIRHLDIMKQSVSKVDDIMLYICLPFIFLYSVFSMVPAIQHDKPLFVAVAVAQIIQAVLQTALICDGLRRCSNSTSLSTKKPGRELITFLVVANIAMWLLETFEIKSAEGNYYKYKFYGKSMWTLLSHSTLPLALFYRFHSSVCLVDIWKAGYEPEPEH